MKRITIRPTIAALLVLLAIAPAFGSEPNAAQQALFEARATALKNKNADGVLATYHSDIQAQAAGLKQLLQARLAAVQLDEVSLSITDVIHPGDPALLNVSHKVRGSSDGKPFDVATDYFYITKDENGVPRVLQELEAVDKDSIDTTGSFVSPKGGFAIQLPPGWLASKAPDPLGAMLIDSVNGISPDLAGNMLIGVVQLPMNLPPEDAAKLAAQTDAASMRTMAASYKMLSEGPTQLAGMPGWSIVSEFQMYGESYKRSQLYYGNESLVYFIISDMTSVAERGNEAKVREEITSAVASFRLVSIDEELTVSEQIRADLGQGTITGSIYSNEKFGCFIAAPEGWTLRTSSTPNTLVEMQRTGGRSIIRVLAEENIPSTISAETAFRGRLDQVSKVVQNFREKPAKKVPLAGTEAWVSEHTYTMSGLGDFGVKEATFLRNGKYYLILCQAISPDDYTTLAADFDKTIASFGFSD